MSGRIPKPGKPVRGSKTGKPIMALFDLLGRTWALGVIWQLSDASMTFRQIQESCEMVSPTVLNRRLKELISSGFIERTDSGYQLSAMGLELFQLLKPFGAWSMRWAESLPLEDGDT